MDFTMKYFDDLELLEFWQIVKKRIEVFVVEQKCSYMEVDDDDLISYHAYLSENKDIVSYLRIIVKKDADYAVIGRVFSTVRRKAYATELLNRSIDFIKKELKLKKIKLEAQVYAKSLYEKAGFKTSSDNFFIDGIEHVEMTLDFSEER